MSVLVVLFSALILFPQIFMIKILFPALFFNELIICHTNISALYSPKEIVEAITLADNPLITISIPAYNLGSYLAKTLESILNQTYQNFEVILVDDASTDRTPSTIAKYADKDDRIHAHYFQSHEGVSKARNYAINNAKGDIIVFVDGDDLLEPQYLEVMARGLSDPSVDLVAVGYNWGWRGGSGGGNQFREVSKTNAYASINRRGGDFGGYTWNKGFKMSIIREHNIQFDESLDLAEDLLFTLTTFLLPTDFCSTPRTIHKSQPFQ